jgi:alkylation response protein AidB-like acyl-CoA dehydrogenase
MDFTWSAEQLAMREAVLEFARRLPLRELAARDAGGRFDRQAWREFAEFGLQGMPFPEELGGGGHDILTSVLALEAAGQGCRDGGLLFSVGAQMWSVQMPILRHGSSEQQQKYLPRLCSGEWIGAHAMSEPDSGSDAFALRTTAAREGLCYVLNGTKTFVTSAPEADLFLVFATVDRSLGALGVTGFLVERSAAGLTVSEPIAKMGLTTSPMAELVLDNCEVPVSNRLGREGRGAGIFNDSMEWERACIMAPYLGAMQRQIETCVAHAKRREQFGKAIAEFQAVAHRIVAMKLRLDAARLLVYRAVSLKQSGAAAGVEASLAKLYLSEAWVQSCLDAVQVHGGYGYTREYGLERELRDAVGGTLYSGTSDIQRAIVARGLGL